MDAAWQRGLEVLNPDKVVLEHGLELHQKLAVCENYGFMPKVIAPHVAEAVNELQDRGASQTDWKRKTWVHRVTSATLDENAAAEYIEAMNRAGVCGMIQNISDVGESLQDALTLMAGYRHICNVFKNRMFQATCAEDLEQAKATGRTGVIFSLTGLPIEGTGSIIDLEGLLDWVDVWYQLGVRFMHLGYNRKNYFADGCTETNDGGLSDLGRDLIARMNRAGIIVDVPHSSRKSTFDAVAASSRPVVATHVGCAAIHDHPRGKTDAEIKAIADSGGYVGIVGVPMILGPDADLNLLLRHVEHVINLVGADHVAVGTDLGYDGAWPEDLCGYPTSGNAPIDRGGWKPEHRLHAKSLEHVSGSLAWTNSPLITVGLVKMGLSETDIEKVLGGNLRRVLRACRPENEVRFIF